MTSQLSSDAAIAYLKQYLTSNKARGMIAEIGMGNELVLIGNQVEKKLLAGAWLLSPKNAHQYRHCIFVLSELFTSQSELYDAMNRLETDRGWQALAHFLSFAGIGVVVSGGIAAESVRIENIEWRHAVLKNEKLHSTEGDAPFINWPGSRGRASKNHQGWTRDIEERYSMADTKNIVPLMLRQAFYYSYLKQQLQKPLEDPYDVDAFVVSFTGKVMPVEIKEKSRTPTNEFGVDAGRILMLLRLCLVTDSNALYLIREIDNLEGRNLIAWRYITLADLVMKCRWNLQGGGRGMLGGATQTIMLPCELFQTFSSENLSEKWLNENGSLQASVHLTAHELAIGLSNYLLTLRSQSNRLQVG